MTDLYTQDLGFLQAVMGAVAPDIDSTPDSVLYNLLQVTASLAVDVQNSQTNATNAAYSSTATGANLKELAADAGLTPLLATPATGSVTFTAGASGATVPATVRVWTNASTSGAPIYFTLQAQIVVPANGTASGSVTCNTSGALGNLVAGAIAFSDPVQGVTSVTNLAAFSGGQDAETDTALRTRIDASRTVLYSDDAISTAAEGVPGCFAAYTSDPHDGSAHVTVYAAQADGTLPTALQSAVQSAVNGVLVITTTATVSPFTLVYQAVTLGIAVQSGYDSSTVKANVNAAVLAYVPTLPEGTTLQPGPMWAAVTAQVAGLADWNTTSTLPTVAATALFRFLAAPSGATTSQASTGGSMSNGPVYLVYSWLTAGGESVGSAEAVVTLNGGTSTQTITVTAPATFPYGATDLKVYASPTPGAESYQNQIATPGGTLTLTTIATGGATPLTTGTLSAPTITVNAL